MSIDNRILSDRARANGHRRARRVLPVVSTTLSRTGLGLTSLRTLVFGHNPNTFDNVHVGATIIRTLSITRSVPYIDISDLRTVTRYTCRGCNRASICDTLSTHVRRICFKRCTTASSLVRTIGRRGNRSARRLLSCSDRAVLGVPVTNGKTSLLTLHSNRVVRTSVRPSTAIVKRLNVTRFVTANNARTSRTLPGCLHGRT